MGRPKGRRFRLLPQLLEDREQHIKGNPGGLQTEAIVGRAQVCHLSADGIIGPRPCNRLRFRCIMSLNASSSPLQPPVRTLLHRAMPCPVAIATCPRGMAARTDRVSMGGPMSPRYKDIYTEPSDVRSRHLKQPWAVTAYGGNLAQRNGR